MSNNAYRPSIKHIDIRFFYSKALVASNKFVSSFIGNGQNFGGHLNKVNKKE